jgi:hypothetical protein
MCSIASWSSCLGKRAMDIRDAKQIGTKCVRCHGQANVLIEGWAPDGPAEENPWTCPRCHAANTILESQAKSLASRCWLGEATATVILSSEALSAPGRQTDPSLITGKARNGAPASPGCGAARRLHRRRWWQPAVTTALRPGGSFTMSQWTLSPSRLVSSLVAQSTDRVELHRAPGGPDARRD